MTSMTIRKTLVTFLATLSLVFAGSLIAAEKAKVSDENITNEVKRKIHTNRVLGSTKIEVKTKEGIVSLKGDIKSKDEANTAVEVAQSVPGVKDVDTSQLKVEGSAHPILDAYITAKVKGVYLRDKLFGDKPISVTGVHVETKDGIVHLSGNVENETIAKDAEELAKTVKGVKGVKSTIKIKS